MVCEITLLLGFFRKVLVMRIPQQMWLAMAALATLALALAPTPACAQDVDGQPLATHATTTAGDAFGDEEAVPYSLRMLMQTRYGQTFADSARQGDRSIVENGDGWQINRMFLRAMARPTAALNGRMLLDFAELVHNAPQRGLKLAYVEWDPASRVKIYAGWFKRSFSLLELLPIADYEFADGGPTDQLIKDCGFGGRDAGAMVRLSPLPKKRWLKLYLGAFQGLQVNSEAQTSGLLTTRAETTAWKHLHLGADFAWRRHQTGNAVKKEDPLDAGFAWSADAMLQFENWQLRAEVLGGDRTDMVSRRNPDLAEDAKHFLGAWFLAAMRLPVKSGVFMPAARVEWLDADREHDVGQRWLFTAGLNFEFDANMRLLLDVTRQNVQAGSLPLSQPPAGAADNGAPWSAFHESAFTKIIVQLQVKI